MTQFMGSCKVTEDTSHEKEFSELFVGEVFILNDKPYVKASGSESPHQYNAVGIRHTNHLQLRSGVWVSVASKIEITHS